MPSNYVLLSKNTVSAGASSITFSNIPQTGYTDLVVKVSARSSRPDSSIDSFFISFNSTTTGYSRRELYAEGAAIGSESVADRQIGAVVGNTALANTFGSAEIYIPNYTASTYKSFSTDILTENNGASTSMWLTAGLWSNTAAINSITFTPSGANTFLSSSTFYLYGISNVNASPAIAPYAYGGDAIMTDGNYWYHGFKYSGSFSPIKGLSCDILVVAGGGAGGGGQGGGGGAGGVLAFASQIVSATQTVTVGAGGVGVARDSVGNSGGNSQFGSLTAAIGGGGGGCYGAATAAGTTGGSGGGAGAKNTGNPISGAAGTSGQGNAGGGVTSYTAPYNGGGGGGAGGVGTAGAGSSTGAGGAGVNTVTNWGSLSTALTTLNLGVSGYIAGGGAGGGDTTAPGAGGSGGGGGGSTGVGVSGTPNTGSGGQGSTYSGAAASGSGGSGLVIVRYAV